MRQNYTTEVVEFHRDELTALVTKDGKKYVGFKSVINGLGLQYDRQLSRVKADPVLLKGILHMTIPSSGGPQRTVLIEVKFLNLYLAKLNSNKVRENLRENLIVYQLELVEAIDNHFQCAQRKLYDWSKARSSGKIARRAETDEIQKRSSHHMAYKNVTDASYKALFGMNAKKLREQLGLEPRQSVKTHLGADDLWLLKDIEFEIADLIVQKDAQGTKQMMACAKFVAERRLETSKLSKQLVLPERKKGLSREQCI